ncbi:MAG TPA: hypothetical protein VG406_22390 [Isosphaeraceae bacterium]|nr:hypothetical protein [Isosphaeraceae bacterium]
MSRTLARRARPARFRPRLEGLEDRALAAAGQVELILPVPPVGTNALVKGDLPDGGIDVATYQLSSHVASGKLVFDPLTIITHSGPQSPGLFATEANGIHFPAAVLMVRNDAAQVIATYTLGVVFVSSQSESIASGDGTQTETDVLTFGSLQANSYNPATTALTATSTWSQVTNSPTLTIQALTSDPVATALTLKTSRVNGPGGPEVLLRAKATSAGGVPVGNVSFYSGTHLLGALPVQADGTASLTVPAAAVPRGRAYAIFSGGPGSSFQPSSSVSGQARMQRLFQASFHRAMNPDEWALTSMWLQQGFTPNSMASIYRSLAAGGH